MQFPQKRRNTGAFLPVPGAARTPPIMPEQQEQGAFGRLVQAIRGGPDPIGQPDAQRASRAGMLMRMGETQARSPLEGLIRGVSAGYGSALAGREAKARQLEQEQREALIGQIMGAENYGDMVQMYQDSPVGNAEIAQLILGNRPKPPEPRYFNSGGDIVQVMGDQAGRIYEAPEPPPEPPKPPAGFVYTEDGNLAFIPGGPQDPDQVARIAGARGPSTSVTVNSYPEGYAEPTRPTVNALQADLAGDYSMLGTFQEIKAAFDPDDLTYAGRVGRNVNEVRDKLPFWRLSGDEATDLERQTQFRQNTEQLFNEYRREITGAAAPLAELEQLRQTMLNTDLGPTQFAASMKQFEAKLTRSIRLRNQLMRKGYPPLSDEWDQNFDKAWNQGMDDTAAERIDDLVDSGLDPVDDADRIMAILDREGYQ